MRKIFKWTCLINLVICVVLAIINQDPNPDNWVENDFNRTTYGVMFCIWLLPPVVYYPFWIKEWEENRKNRAKGTNKW